MCGILGTIINNNEMNSVSAFDARQNGFFSIKKRGPDGLGSKQFQCFGHSVFLAHSRLSIIELSENGSQPMQDEVSGWWITYNGEIYNYLEIREELRGLGWSFRGGSDTEVLLKAWAQWGIDALPHLNGMFAFAAFNSAKGELWLVRDRFGVKPLAWGHLLNRGITFSSSVAGIAEQVGDELDVDYCARGVRYMAYETAQSGSPFRKVNTVPPGAWVKFQLSESTLNFIEGQWYNLPQAVATRHHRIAECSDDELVELCRNLLEDSVRIRLRSDVPVAVSLSGGLDSSSVAALAAKRVEALRGFTYGSPLSKESEGPDVQIFSNSIGIDVTYIWPNFDKDGLDDAFERTMEFQEAPFCGLSLIAQNEVFRNVRKAGFKVLLGGQGGDEIFAGYRKFFVVALREALHQKDVVNALRLIYSLGLMLANEVDQTRMYWQNLNRYSNKGKVGFRLLDWRQVTVDLWGNTSMPLSTRQIEDIQHWSLPTLLRYEDRNSMGYGVESRLPFMDYRLIELALALPPRLKVSNGYGKWMLRKMVAGTVPDLIRLNRKKRGFDVTQDWIVGGIGASLRRQIHGNRQALADHMQCDADLDLLLSDISLSQDNALLNEALMLTWLVKPIRSPRGFEAKKQ